MDAEAIQRSFDGSGLRCTPQRYAVMAFLMEHNRHPTAAEIFEAVNRVDPRSSRATTYNNLRDLVQAAGEDRQPGMRIVAAALGELGDHVVGPVLNAGLPTIGDHILEAPLAHQAADRVLVLVPIGIETRFYE